MPKYISCITRMLLNSHRIFMSACPGEPSLYDTHCQFCHYWVDNLSEGTEDGANVDDDEDENILGEGDDAEFSRENLSEQSEDGNNIHEDEEENE